MIFKKIKLDWKNKEEEAMVHQEALASFHGYDFRFTITSSLFERDFSGRVEARVKSGYSGVIWRTIYCYPPENVCMPLRISYKEVKKTLESYAYRLNKTILKNSFTK